ncbi:MAG TPA: nucleotide disphospho-sugar-binding domain-containing protein [Solirubrobacteraceae bacterium]|jgi:UDP:flavonoid glycosyltransferase YjiC (YdhE family)
MKVLAYTSPARGHLYPVVPIMAELARRGHRASLYSLAGELEQLASLGIEASAIDPAIERIEIEDYRERSQLGAIRSVFRAFLKRSASEGPDLEAAIAKHDPDVLLIDINCWGAATVAEASGRPWAMYSPYLLPLPSKDAPAYGPGFRPLRGPLGSVRDALVNRVSERISFQSAMPQINTLRSAHGLPALTRFEELLARPPLLFSLTAEGFEYPRGDWPKNVRLVGPMNWSPPLDVGPRDGLAPRAAPEEGAAFKPSSPEPTSLQPARAPAWLADLIDPLVLVTCSTERQRDKRLLHVALEALPGAGMSVLGTTAAHDPAAFEVPPGNKVVRFVSHDAVLERAACVVCHGGLGITQKALAAEVPVVVVPFGRDQAETSRRVEFAKAGVRLPPRRLTPQRLLDAVRGAMECREGAQRVSRAYAAAGGAPSAADAIEAIGHRPTPARGDTPPRADLQRPKASDASQSQQCISKASDASSKPAMRLRRH